MRLAVLIKDEEYRDALVDKISSYDNNIFVNIVDGPAKDTSECLILTDILPSQIDSKVLSAIKNRTVFLTGSEDSIPEGLSSVFKFRSIPYLISELSIAYDSWHGIAPGIDHTARFITVCCESDAYSADHCNALARQIIYRHGGKVLILPLSYINDYGRYDAGNTNTLSRLLYSIHSGRERGTESYAYTDSYGVSGLIMRPGANPVAQLDEDELRMLVSGLSRSFDTVIGDVATCFRKENRILIEMSDHMVIFERGRRDAGLDELIESTKKDKSIRIKITGGTEDAMAIDDCVKRIYGMESNEGFKS